jgi:xylitol oxidase
MSTSRRRFLELSVAAIGSSAATRGGRAAAGAEQASGAAPGTRLTNWAGNYTYGVDELLEARSLEEVRDAVRSRPRLKALGTRHCFNGIADSRDNLLSLRPMAEVVALDPAAGTVTVEAGISYGQLCPDLEERGFALHNLASLPHISVAGAAATATHGSGIRNGNLASAVTALEMVTAAGEVRALSRESDADLFRGAVVHLGALGVLTRVTLEVQPSYRMTQHVYLDLPMAELRDHFEEIVSAGYSVSLFTDWQDQRVGEVWIKRRVGPDTSGAAEVELYGARLADRNVHPIATLSAENCTEQMGVPGPWYDRLPHFRMGFTPSSGKELQSEYFVARSDAVEAIQAIERLREQVGPHLMISELRTIAADDLWMSTAYGRDSLAIHFTWRPDWPAVSRLLPVIERELSPFGVRPHWGKLFTLSPTQLRSRYERLDDFVGLARQLDPGGRFQNDFLRSTVFA